MNMKHAALAYIASYAVVPVIVGEGPYTYSEERTLAHVHGLDPDSDLYRAVREELARAAGREIRTLDVVGRTMVEAEEALVVTLGLRPMVKAAPRDDGKGWHYVPDSEVMARYVTAVGFTGGTAADALYTLQRQAEKLAADWNRGI